MKRDHIYARYAYVTYEDLEFLNKHRSLKARDDSDDEDSDQDGNSLDNNDDDIDAGENNNRDMILAIRAPYGSTLEIPLEA